MAKILIVDDAEVIRITLTQMLTKHGFGVVGAADDGRTAIKQYEALKPDLILMDITMPGMDGITAIKKIRELDASAKIIVVSSMANTDCFKEAIGAGAKSFITKPYSEALVIDTLRTVLTED